MDWARILAYVTGMVDQELLARNEISGHRKPHPEVPVEWAVAALRRRASHARRDRHRLGRKVLGVVPLVAWECD
jgi:putative transposase